MRVLLYLGAVFLALIAMLAGGCTLALLGMGTGPGFGQFLLLAPVMAGLAFGCGWAARWMYRRASET